MNRRLYQEADQWESMPHVGGDEPSRRALKLPGRCMPHVGGDEPVGDKLVLLRERMPHVCGDEPTMAQTAIATIGYAPRMWG